MSQHINQIVYGHSLAVGTGAGRYTGGLVQSLAFGGSDSNGREYSHYASHQVGRLSCAPSLSRSHLHIQCQYSIPLNSNLPTSLYHARGHMFLAPSPSLIGLTAPEQYERWVLWLRRPVS